MNCINVSLVFNAFSFPTLLFFFNLKKNLLFYMRIPSKAAHFHDPFTATASIPCEMLTNINFCLLESTYKTQNQDNYSATSDATMPPKPKPVHTRSPISKTTFGKSPSLKLSPTSSSPSYSLGKYNKLYVTACRGGTEIVVTITDPSGQHSAFVKPLVTFFDDPHNGAFTKDKLRCHYVGKLRDPTDAQLYKLDPPTSTGFEPPYYFFVSFLDDNKVEKNTPDYREKLGKAFCITNNSRPVQTGYYHNKPGCVRANHCFEFAGDLTPPGDFTNAPYLSDYLTIGDLMGLLTQMFNNEETGAPLTDIDIAQDMDLLKKYYSPDLIPQVRKIYIPKKRDDGSIPAATDLDRFGSIDIPDLSL